MTEAHAAKATVAKRRLAVGLDGAAAEAGLGAVAVS